MTILPKSELKIKISGSIASGLSLKDINFVLTFINDRKSVSFKKEDCIIREDEDDIYVILDTGKLGAGVYRLKATLWIPDADEKNDGFREVYLEGETDIEVGNG